MRARLSGAEQTTTTIWRHGRYACIPCSCDLRMITTIRNRYVHMQRSTSATFGCAYITIIVERDLLLLLLHCYYCVFIVTYVSAILSSCFRQCYYPQCIFVEWSFYPVSKTNIPIAYQVLHHAGWSGPVCSFGAAVGDSCGGVCGAATDTQKQKEYVCYCFVNRNTSVNTKKYKLHVSLNAIINTIQYLSAHSNLYLLACNHLCDLSNNTLSYHIYCGHKNV